MSWFIPKAIIFDFDGVIAESVEVKSNAFAELYRPYGADLVEKVINHHHANGGMSRYEKFRFYHKEFLDIVLTDKEVDKLSLEFSRLVVEKVISAPYVPGTFEFISQNYNQFEMFLSTGTPLDEMNTILKRRNLNGYFKNIYGAPEKKNMHISQILTNYHFRPDEMLFIGDADTDMEAAAEHKVPFVLRIHEHNHEQFEGYKGEKIYDLKDLMRLLLDSAFRETPEKT